MLIYAQGAVTETAPRMPAIGEVGWLHVDKPTKEVLEAVLQGTFGCHPLEIEDITHLGQRPKVTPYQNGTHSHVFITFYAVGKHVKPAEFSIIVGDSYVITVAETPMEWLAKLYESARNHPEMLADSGTILHRVLDECVDGYFAVLDMLEERLDELERQVFDNVNAPNLSGVIFHLKRRLHKVRRVASEGRNVVGLLTHEEFPYTNKAHQVYFLDVYDHISRVVDGFDAIRDNLSGLLDLQTAQRANRMNEIMKTLAIISTIFLPLSFIVGLYDMNFHYIPELTWSFGYLYVWALMVAVASGFIIYFKKRGWW